MSMKRKITKHQHEGDHRHIRRAKYLGWGLGEVLTGRRNIERLLRDEYVLYLGLLVALPVFVYLSTQLYIYIAVI